MACVKVRKRVNKRPKSKTKVVVNRTETTLLMIFTLLIVCILL